MRVLWILIVLSTSAMAREPLRLVSWQPSPRHVWFLLPARPGETGQEAVSRYLTATGQDAELQVLYKDYPPHLGAGLTQPYAPQDQRPRIVLMANSAKDMGPYPRRLLNNKALFTQSRRDVGVSLLPVVADAGLSDEERIYFYELLMRQFVGIGGLGGADIDPSFYQGDPALSIHYNRARDAASLPMVRYLIKNGAEQGKFFVFGYCRGMQELAVAIGCPLLQNVEPQSVHRNGYHPIEVASSSFIGEQTNGQTANVYSLHRQSILIPDSHCIVRATAQHGGINEVCESGNGLVQGFQSHPELMALRGDPLGQRVLDGLAKKMWQLYDKRQGCELLLSLGL
jgi:putative glutamine amidotransferase